MSNEAHTAYTIRVILEVVDKWLDRVTLIYDNSLLKSSKERVLAIYRVVSKSVFRE